MSVRISLTVPCRDQYHEITVEVISWWKWRVVSTPCTETLGPVLGRIADCVQYVKERDTELRVEVLRAVEQHGEDGVPILVEALEDEDEDVRYKALIALKHIASPSSLPALKKVLEEEEDGEIRLDAIEAIARIGEEEDVSEILLEALRNDFWQVRAYACDVIPRLVGKPAVPALCEAVWDEDHFVQETACRALGVIGDAEAVPALSQVLLYETRREPRVAACWALEKIGDAQAIPALEKAAQDEDEEVARAARAALKAIRQ